MKRLRLWEVRERNEPETQTGNVVKGNLSDDQVVYRS